MKKIKIYYAKTNAYNAIVFVNVTDKKVIVLDTTKSLSAAEDEYKDPSNLNNFYDIPSTSDDIYGFDVLNDFELVKKIAEYDED